MSLYPTKTRLAMLRAIGGDEVIERDGLYLQGYDGTRDLRVTARTQELIKAGWAELADRSWNGVWRKVRITEDGRQVLAEHFPEQWGEDPGVSPLD